MRRNFVRNSVKCGEFCFHRFHHIAYLNLPQKVMRRILVRKAVKLAVNFCKEWVKCSELFFHRIHRNHRDSYKNSPH